MYEQPPSRSVKSLKRKMEILHSKYVFAPTDKAANNVTIIWKRYYVDILKGKLNSTSTYVHAQLMKDKLLWHHIDTLTKINDKIDKCELSTFYWVPTLNKNPFKSRFISNSSHCSTTILSKHIISALSDTLHWSGITPIFDHIADLDLITKFDLLLNWREVSIEHLQRVRHANKGRLLLRTPGPVPLLDLQVF